MNWRTSIWLLSIQYVGVFLLISLSWRIEMAVVKLLAGWFAGAILGMAIDAHIDIEFDQELHGDKSEASWPTGRFFRTFAAALLWLAIWLMATNLIKWMPGVTLLQLLGGLVLLGLGILHLGLTADPFRVAIGLLTVLGGFEILYATVEKSTLVAGLLAVINLGLALTGAYLLTVTKHALKTTQEEIEQNPVLTNDAPQEKRT